MHGMRAAFRPPAGSLRRWLPPGLVVRARTGDAATARVARAAPVVLGPAARLAGPAQVVPGPVELALVVPRLVVPGLVVPGLVVPGLVVRRRGVPGLAVLARAVRRRVVLGLAVPAPAGRARALRAAAVRVPVRRERRPATSGPLGRSIPRVPGSDLTAHRVPRPADRSKTTRPFASADRHRCGWWASDALRPDRSAASATRPRHRGDAGPSRPPTSSARSCGSAVGAARTS